MEKEPFCVGVARETQSIMVHARDKTKIHKKLVITAFRVTENVGKHSASSFAMSLLGKALNKMPLSLSSYTISTLFFYTIYCRNFLR